MDNSVENCNADKPLIHHIIETFDAPYARVSANQEDLRLQWDALCATGCAEKDGFTDKASGLKTALPGLEECIRQLKQAIR